MITKNICIIKKTDIVYRIKNTNIGSIKVHSLEELDYLKNEGDRKRGENYIKIEYNVDFKTLGNINYYEPDLNGLRQENTSLIFYKMENNSPTSDEYIMPVAEWIEKPNQIQQDGNTYKLYDYENKIWANIRINNGSIETNWTWIPRYAYKNGITSTTDTDVKLIIKQQLKKI